MAETTLESLRIEVNASAQNASSGISSMIAPLRSLARAVGTVLPAMKDLNRQLKIISNITGAGGITAAGTKAVESRTKAVQALVSATTGFKKPQGQMIAEFAKEQQKILGWKWQPWRYGPRLLPEITNNMAQNTTATGGLRPESYLSREEWEKQADANREAVLAKRAEAEAARSIQQTTSSATPVASNAITSVAKASSQAVPAVKNVNNAIKETASVSNTAAKNVKEEAQSTEEAGKAATNAAPKVTRFAKELSTIGRMFKSILIRTALRALIKSFSESWQAAYAFSSKMGGSFAKSVDAVRGAFASVSLTAIQTFAPVLQALVPIVTVVANAINYLCSAIQWLLSLLGMSSDLLGASTKQMDKFRKSSGGGGGGNKGQLAKFDELNVIQTSAGGGGGGGGGSGLDVFNQISSEISAITQLLVGEGLIAVGLILAFSGHVPLGVALAAVGAAAIAKTVINDWGKLTEDVKGQLAEIMVYASGAFLGLGLILALNGHIPLGIALMAVGAANLATAAYLGNTNQIPEEIKAKLTKIMVIAGASLLAIGAILAFSGAAVPLGIGLMAAGGVALGAAVAMNWGSLSEKVKSVFKSVCDFLKNAWESVKKAVNDAWNAVKKWWETSGIGSSVRSAWTATKTFLSDAWKSITGKITRAWDAVVQWWETSGIRDKVGQAWTATKIFFVGLWDGIKTTAVNAWNAVVQWWETSGIRDKVSQAWDSAKIFLNGIWTGIQTTANQAWDAVVKWWETSGIRDSLSNAWFTAKTFLVGIWDSVKLGCTKAWDAVSEWWNTNVAENVKKEGVWGGVKGFFHGIFGDSNSGIVKWAADAWVNVKRFWSENFTEKIKEMWSGIREFFEDLFKPLKDAADWVTTILGLNGQTINTTVNVTQKNGTKTTTTIPLKTFSVADAVNAVAKPSNYVVKNSQKTMDTIFKGLLGFADGGYGIPRGDLFLANEKGAELIGSMNGKTTVANQEQIIEGIQRGVYDANSEQNALLRQQNELLQRILEKDASVRIGASSALGRVVTQSQQMYARQVGG